MTVPPFISYTNCRFSASLQRSSKLPILRRHCAFCWKGIVCFDGKKTSWQELLENVWVMVTPNLSWSPDALVKIYHFRMNKIIQKDQVVSGGIIVRTRSGKLLKCHKEMFDPWRIESKDELSNSIQLNTIMCHTQHLEKDRCLRRFGDLDLLRLRSEKSHPQKLLELNENHKVLAHQISLDFRVLTFFYLPPSFLLSLERERLRRRSVKTNKENIYFRLLRNRR